MSVLSNLEQELGLQTFDISIFEPIDLLKEDEDFSSSFQQQNNIGYQAYNCDKQDLKEYVNEAIQIRNSDKVQFDPIKAATSLGVSTEKVTKLFLEVTQVYQNSNKTETRELCEQLLQGLYNGTIDRSACNYLINAING